MSLATSEYELLRLLVKQHAGITLIDEDRTRVETRLTPVAKASGLASVSQLVAQLRRPFSRLHEQVLEALLAHAQPFLLDERIATELVGEILPTLIGRRRESRRLRFWCPACGGGQAPASLALLLS